MTDWLRTGEDDLQIGFTGTQRGMTAPQWMTLLGLLDGVSGWLHHGDCVGADEEAHDLAHQRGLLTDVHPPSNSSKRAWCGGTVIRSPRPYIARNHDIVDATRGLIAAPKIALEELRSGTWATIRYARKIGKPVALLLPDRAVVITL